MKIFKMNNYLVAFLIIVLTCPIEGFADSGPQFEFLQQRINEQQVMIQQQQTTIRQLMDKIQIIETKLGTPTEGIQPSSSRINLEADELQALPPGAAAPSIGNRPLLTVGGYLDLGYVEPQDRGQLSGESIQINSRGDTLPDIGIDGDSTFLVNNANLDIKANPTNYLEAQLSIDFLPRILSYTATQGRPLPDHFEVLLAYLNYYPFIDFENAVTDNLFGDLKLSLGKFESPIGQEYKINRSPDRVNISRSLISVYFTGYPVGLKAKGKLFQDYLDNFLNSAFTYNLAMVNTDPFITSYHTPGGVLDGLTNIDTNHGRSYMGRISYSFELQKALFEAGGSFGKGPRIAQTDSDVKQTTYGLDGSFKIENFTFRTEWATADKDLFRNQPGEGVFFRGYLFESFYEIRRPDNFNLHIPFYSLTPYYRLDHRYFKAIHAPVLIDQFRHTVALKYAFRPGTTLKSEYQWVYEEGPQIDDNALLFSLIQEF